jgi:hypothetical protein
MDTVRRFTIKRMDGGKADVTFIHSVAKIDSTDERISQVCTCIVRKPDTLFTIADIAIKNPNDTFNRELAERQAYKYAIERIYRNAVRGYRPTANSVVPKEKFMHYYRKQLFKAKNKSEDYINLQLGKDNNE